MAKYLVINLLGIKKKYLFICIWKTELREGEWIFHLQVYLPNGQTSRCWARPKPGFGNFFLVCHRGAGNPASEPSSHCFPRWHISRELDGSWAARNQISTHMGYQHPSWHLYPEYQVLPTVRHCEINFPKVPSNLL